MPFTFWWRKTLRWAKRYETSQKSHLLI